MSARSVVTSAPGKVVLSGEYAVLDGATAISMAVDRRASVSLSPSRTFALECRGVVNRVDTRLVDCVRDVLGIAEPAAALVLDTRPFVASDAERKLGLGSSAALCAALTAALGPEKHRSDALLDAALRAHAVFQGDTGSGVDVATSVSGGLVRYRMSEPPAQLEWPAGLEYTLLWSGVESSTRDKLAALEGRRQSTSFAELRDAANEIAGRWQDGDATAVIAAYDSYVEALAAFDVDHQLGIFDAGHGMLWQADKPDDVVYKPCGAGGGDIGIVLGTDAAAIARFERTAVANGFHRLNGRLDAVGVAWSTAGGD